MNEPLDIEIVKMYALLDPLPRARSLVAEVRCRNAAFTVTLMLYGEAMLSVVRTSAIGHVAAAFVGLLVSVLVDAWSW